MPRSFTIKIKVNLHNYENCDLALTDDAIETDDDIRAMRDDLRRILKLFGQGNDATRDAFASYADRVLGPGPAAQPETPSPYPPSDNSPHITGSGMELEIVPPADKPAAANQPALTQNGSSALNQPALTPAPVQNGEGKCDGLSCTTAAEKMTAEEKRKKQANATFQKEKTKFNAKGAAEASRPENVIRGDYQCTNSECGKDISKAEKDTSELFLGKDKGLCRECLKKVQGGWTVTREPKGAKS